MVIVIKKTLFAFLVLYLFFALVTTLPTISPHLQRRDVSEYIAKFIGEFVGTVTFTDAEVGDQCAILVSFLKGFKQDKDYSFLIEDDAKEFHVELTITPLLTTGKVLEAETFCENLAGKALVILAFDLDGQKEPKEVGRTTIEPLMKASINLV
ncbi:3587_t:CDS:1 [Ambispora gerdemannii]|uniref:3587_t:CDS:1 n=1 Tax=Ambispora gerdemannii TaxID=144530 RepID=A0A9N9DFQ8_9GLOM|nr:3587_t:CDS:1 [Ambispora gerdemannii]